MIPLVISCSTCQANSLYGGGDAVGWSIFFLLIVILIVASAVVFCMIRIARRSREFAQEEEIAMLAELHSSQSISH